MLKKLLELRQTVVFAIVGGAMLWLGWSKYDGTQEDAPTTYSSVEDLAENESWWIDIEKCHLDIVNSSFDSEYSYDEDKEIFIPILTQESKTEYYLKTSDESLIERFDQIRDLMLQITAAKNAISMGEKDPEYLAYKETTYKELLTDLENLQIELEQAIKTTPPIAISIQGMLLSDVEKESLGFSSDDVIIDHNAEPSSSIFVWLLLIGGSISILLSLLTLLARAKEE